MKGIVYCVLLIGVMLSNGCATRQSDIIIDPEGVDMGQYQKDLKECQQIAEQVDQKAVGGAVGGAVVGGAVGAILDRDDRGLEKGAGVGAVLGGSKGARATKREKEKVIKNCLRNRGYTVLN